MIVYRSATPRYARENDLLTGEGSRKKGGRWNPKGIAAVYASLSMPTALAEALSHIRYYRLPEHKALPRTFVAIQIRLKSALDLTDGRIRQRLRVSQDRMLGEDWRKEMRRGRDSLSQSIGRAVYEAGFEGLLVSSAADPDGQNLVWFPDNLGIRSEVEVMPERKA